MHSGSVARIHLNRMKQNLVWLQSRSGTDQVIAVIKANAYGHGDVEVGRYLEPHVHSFAVATAGEGVRLREAGIRCPILVFGPPASDGSALMKRHSLTATLSTYDHFDRLLPGMTYQINFDTGMRRAGFSPAEAEGVLERIRNQQDNRCTGIYSHFATADDPGSDFVNEQHRRFRAVRALFPAEIPAHMCNTAAVVHYNPEPFDMIRVGIGLAGYTPGQVQDDHLEPALEWESHVALVRRVVKGEGVSYGNWWRAPKDGWLATIPVGYADGVPRALNGKFRVAIEGRLWPVVGSITMDFCMVWLGDSRVEEGATVGLMGGPESWRADRWAAEAGTITHEILCRLTERVERVYSR